MDRRHLLAKSGMVAVAALAGCMAPLQEGPGGGEPDDGPDLHDAPTIDDEQLAQLVTGNATFAMDLYRQLRDESSSSLFYSPYSISAALAMTYAGARGETRAQMEDALGFTLRDALHPTFEVLDDALEERETTVDRFADDDEDEHEEVDAFTLNVANALWGDAGFPFAQDYLDLVERHYDAGLHPADFQGDPEGERERINDWVADQTEDRIDELLPVGSITPATILVLTNAIHFMASWLHEFDPDETEQGTFTAVDGSTTDAAFMRQDIRTNYAALDGVQAIELPYVGEEVSMVLILPDEDRFEAFERNLDAEVLFGIFDELHDAKGELALPRFEIESSIQLAELLTELGMPQAFSAGADFSGMVEGDGGGLWIDQIYHDAFVSVDEEGTEAAASTAVVMVSSAPPQWGTLRFDRPFLICIRDRPTDAVLFVGRVTDL